MSRRKDFENRKKLGIPVNKLGERLRKLSEALEPLGMYISAKPDVSMSFDNFEGKLDVVESVTLNIFLFDKETKKG